jgi:DNA-binding CsgD family transcriptional regulator
MRLCIERSKALATLPPFRSWLDCTINTSGYDFRKGQTVSAIFGLTPSEARLLLGLSNGQTLKQYADDSHVTQNTVRTHLKSLFAKTKTSKQSDLIRLMRGMTTVMPSR